MESKKDFLSAQEVAGILGISKQYAYKIVRKLNRELSEQGFNVVRGKVSRNYFEEKYCIRQLAKGS